MGYKIAIPVIAIVSVLFTSGLALDAFADHDIRGKSAYFFDCAGKGNAIVGWQNEMIAFIGNNNGVIHRCAHNWIDGAFAHDGVAIGKHGDAIPNADSSQRWDGKFIDHNLISAGPGSPPTWQTVLNQFDDGHSFTNSDGIFRNYPKLPLPEQANNAKLILRGASWGGGTVTLIASQERCQPSNSDPPIECDNNFTGGRVGINKDIPDFADTYFDFVWLVDPVGTGGTRGQLTDTTGIDNLHPCCPGANRIFGTNVNTVLVYFQPYTAPWPSDAKGAHGFVKSEQKAQIYEEHWVGGFAPADQPADQRKLENPVDPLDPGDNTCDSSEYKKSKNGYSRIQDGDCHGQIGADKAKVIFNRGMHYLKLMNNKPYFEPGVLPAQITLNEGDSGSWLIITPDFPSNYEVHSEMTLTFRDLTSDPELDVDISPDSYFPVGSALVRNGTVTLNALDNTASNVTIQVEDNGFPCGNCTAANSDSMGAKGYWDRESIQVTVHNVPPTIENFETIMAGYDAILLLETSDPSIRDEEAGFNYTINWGDGPPEIVHGNNTHAQIKHEYTNPGKYNITVFATDKDGDPSGSESDTVYTPFVKLLDLIQQFKDDEILNKGNANSFTSKVNSIISSLDKQNYNPVCNLSNALINEIKQGFEKPGKLPVAISGDLIEKIKEEKDTVGCNGGVIDIVKRTIPDGDTAQFSFTGDVSGTIGDGEKIRLGNLTSGTYSSTETITSGWELANILCIANDNTKDLATNSVTINLQENEYAVCVFSNTIDEEIEPSFAGKGFGSASSNTAISGIRLHSSNPSSAQPSDDLTDDKKGSGGDEHLTRPTFGVSHETFETIVDSGFRFNDQSFTINDNHHTPFAQQTVNIGEVNSFEAKIYADKRLKVQEFLFGIPNVGEAHLAELGVEVWYDYNGEIEEVKAIQKSNVIDKETIVATHEKTKCQALDTEEKCDTTNVSMVFLEPLKDKVMAVKAIDYKGRYQITYLNEGVEIAGESLNPMNTFLIPSKVKGEGLVQVTQTAKYSPYWLTDDERLFEMNSFGSFKQINQTFERFEDTGNPYTRVHSGFGGIIAYEQKRANQVFDSNEYISELPDSFAYIFPEPYDRMTDDMKAKMLEQEEIAKKIIEESKVQARW